VIAGTLVATLLILHGLAGVVLIGLTTHQAVAVWKPKPIAAKNFIQAYVNTRSATYTNTVVIFYMATFFGGGLIYPTYVMDVKSTLTDSGMNPPIGLFELKEHLAVFGLAMLPSYWWLWKKASPADHVLARQMNTTVICAIVWLGFVVGYILNNIKGLL